MTKPDYHIRDLRRDELLSDLIHRVGHEIGNPLTSVISLATIIPRLISPQKPAPGASAPRGEVLTADIQAKLEQYANSILDEAWRINTLNQRVVLLLSARAGNVLPHEPAALLRRAVTRCQKLPSAQEMRIEIHDESKQRTISVDGDQFIALSVELLQNALEATGEVPTPSRRPIEIHLRSEKTLFEVRMTNVAAAPLGENLSAVFKPFFTSRAGKHLGLGLTVAYAITDRFSGTIAVQEELTKTGNQFTVSLKFPVSDATARGISTIKVDSPPARQTPKNAQKGGALTILIIDDEKSVASAIEKILQHGLGDGRSLRFLHASGLDALPILDGESQLDLILCDLRLHDTNGVVLFEHMLTVRSELRDRFVFLTGDPLQSEESAQLNQQMYIATAGCVCLGKPFDAQDLLDVARKIIG